MIIYNTDINGMCLSDLPSGWPLAMHSHDYFPLFLFVQGDGIFYVEDDPFPIHPDHLFLVPPGTRHGIDSDHSLLSYYEIKFNILDNELRLALRCDNKCDYVCSPFIRESIILLKSFFTKESPFREKHIDMQLSSLLLTLKASSFDSLPHPSFIKDDSYQKVTKEILGIIDSTYMEEITLKGLSESIGKSPQHLCTVFKKDMGITINEYLNYVRILNACVLFYYCHGSVSAIAFHVGFTTTQHFTRVFKKVVGCTPFQFNHYFAKHSEEELILHHPINAQLFDMRALDLQEFITEFQTLGKKIQYYLNQEA